jgi:hypothetical protein
MIADGNEETAGATKLAAGGIESRLLFRISSE